MNFLSILSAAFGIGLLIFVHELGHYLAARLAGVRVERFSLGFGPRLCAFHWGGTEFRVAAVPFGGYVMVAGADPSDRRYPRAVSLYARSILHRALFWSGGVLMNVLFALIVFPIVFHAGVAVTAPVIGSVEAGGPGWVAGLQPGDRVRSLQGKAIRSFDTLLIEVALHGHRPLQIGFERGGAEHAISVMPRFDADRGLYDIGIEPATELTALVVDDGPAHAAGLLPGDLLRSFDGAELGDGRALLQTLQRGGPLVVAAERDGTPLTVTIREPRPAAGQPPRIGVTALPREVLGIRPGSKLIGCLGLQPGDVVLAADGRAFLDGDLETLAVGPEELRLVVSRAGQEVMLAAPATAAARAAPATHVALGADGSMRLLPLPDGAARAAGLRPGDRVERVDGVAIATWSDLQHAVEAAADRPLRFTLRRLPAAAPWFDAATGDLPAGEVVELLITPRVAPGFDYGLAILRSPVQTEIKATGLGDALWLGATSSIDLVKQAYVTLKRMLTGDVGAKNLGGIVRISEFSYRAAERGPSWFWYFLGLISLNLAFVNLLPIPVLDGGHMLFLLIERVKGSPVSARVHGYSQIVGLVFVLLLVLFVTYNDIMRLL